MISDPYRQMERERNYKQTWDAENKEREKMTAPTHAGSSTTKIGMRATFLLLFYFRFSNRKTVISTSMQRWHIASTLVRRCIQKYKKNSGSLSSVLKRCNNVDVKLAYCVDVDATLHRSCHKKRDKKMTAPTHAGSSTTRIGMRATSLPFLLFSTFYPTCSKQKGNVVSTSRQR